jgi:hypothetical protein
MLWLAYDANEALVGYLTWWDGMFTLGCPLLREHLKDYLQSNFRQNGNAKDGNMQAS